MTSSVSENHQFHQAFTAGTQQLQNNNFVQALHYLTQAKSSALAIADDELLGPNARQNYVTTSLIIMGVQFRQQRYADTLASYYQVFHLLDRWLATTQDYALKKRLRGYQALAEKACRHLHLERFREEASYAHSTK
ncbi:hypothetical protein [Idiomarina seosinensis]|uniref:Uncharacterized protein n=1 Tax=Idiomarina seosinensis TaxID=281739 RepID=A0A432ZBT5_9GAMM|nr:hypothetical protein [Idiomarina seosinensis]RUO75369.1 hypothetical protein CWI81_10370 [Idiomarina seosinensis]